MKKLILTLGLVLSMGGLTATQAQMRIYNSNLVKFGEVNTSPTLSSGLEVAMPSFLFKGKQAKFTIMGTTLELLANNAAATPYTTNRVSSDDANIAITMGPSLSIVGVKDKLGLGSSAQPFYSVFATKLYSASGGVSTLSDRRYKTNIRNIESASDKIMHLRPVAFDYTDEKDNAATVDSTRMNKIGLIAQELVEVVPEAVQYLVPDDIYTVDYTLLIPLLIKTAQEQQAQIAEQQAQIAEQQSLLESQQLQIEDLQMAVAADNAALSTPAFSNVNPDGSPAGTLEATGNRLWSNVPNPFKRETRIRYALTDDVREAQLCIYDLSGRQLSCHRLNDRGQSEFVLRAASLNPGIYLYSLIADGQVVDTHRMVVTE